MVRALAKGYMPSTEQLIVNLRTLLASDFLNPDNPDLSDSGRLLLKYSKQWLADFIETIRHKNGTDQIQDFVWFLSKSRISLDTEDLAKTASNFKAKADATAGTLLSYRFYFQDADLISANLSASLMVHTYLFVNMSSRLLVTQIRKMYKLKFPSV